MKIKHINYCHLWLVLCAALVVLLMPASLCAQEVVDESAAPVIDTGTTAWMLTSTALVLLMVPGLALFYGGLVRTKNVLGTMMHAFVAMAIIGVSWVVVGYALCWSDTTLGGVVGWDKNLILLRAFETREGQLTSGIPSYLFAMFQGKFAIIAPALIAGAFAERIRFRSYCVFILLWSLLVYCPLCHMIWNEHGLLGLKAIDLAGGSVIHVSAGAAGLVAALMVGKRRGYPRTAMHPNNLVMTLLGAGLLWVGWFGFNSGSTVASNIDTSRALAMTQIAAATGALSWAALEGVLHRKVTSLGLVSGILAGLVAITPAAGAVTVAGALAVGGCASVLCYFAILLKGKMGYDDTLDVFGIHGVAAIFGGIALMFFLRPTVLSDLGTSWGQQMWYQIEGLLVSIGLSATVTVILLLILKYTIGLRLPVSEEQAGLDHSCHGEHGYGYLTTID